MANGITVFGLMSNEIIIIEKVAENAIAIVFALFILTVQCVPIVLCIVSAWKHKPNVILHPLQDYRSSKQRRKRVISCIETRLLRISYKKRPNCHQYKECNEVGESAKSGDISIGVPS